MKGLHPLDDAFEHRRLLAQKRDLDDQPFPEGRPDLPGTFGMHEMEAAAGRILQKAMVRKVDLKRVTCRIEEMFGETERHGFLHLLMGGYLQTMFSVTGNSARGEFLPTDRFVEKVLATYVMKS